MNRLEPDTRGKLWRVSGTPEFEGFAIYQCGGVREPVKKRRGLVGDVVLEWTPYVLVEACPYVWEQLNSQGGTLLEYVHPKVTGDVEAMQFGARKLAAARENASPIEDVDFSLYVHQRTGVHFAMAGGSLIWDKTGLGKTVTSLVAAETHAHKVLIVTVKSNRGFWASEAEKLFGSGREDAFVPLGTLSTRCELVKRWLANSRMSGPCFVVLNWEAFAPIYSMGAFEHEVPDALIFDEAHKLKDPKTQQSQAGFELSKRVLRRGGRVYQLTATPTDGSPHHLWAQLRCVEPDRFTSYWRFFGMFVNSYPTEYGPKPHPLQPGKNLKVLDDLLKFHAIQRRHADCADIPPVVEHTLVVPMHRRQAEAYEQMARTGSLEDDYGTLLTAPNGLARATRLRQLSVYPNELGVCLPDSENPKFQAVLEHLQGLERESNAVVFCQFKPPLAALQKLFLSLNVGRETMLFTGDTKASADEAAEWISARRGRVLLTTHQKGGTALNLQGAQVAYRLDLPWSSILYEQEGNAVNGGGRLARPGQTAKHVLYVDIMAEGSVDFKVRTRLQSKQAFTESLMAEEILKELAQEGEGTNVMFSV